LGRWGMNLLVIVLVVVLVAVFFLNKAQKGKKS
jgi:hypothetical protein